MLTHLGRSIIDRIGIVPGWCLVAICVIGIASSSPAVADDDSSLMTDPTVWVKGGIRDPAPVSTLEYKRQFELNYRSVLKSKNLSNSNKAILEGAMHYQMATLALHANRHQRMSMFDRIRTDLRTSSTTAEARTFVLDTLIKLIPRLLKEDSPELRVAAVRMLGLLDVSSNPNVPYIGAAPPLLEVLKRGDEEIHLKALAAKALGRILESGSPHLTLRVEIAEALAAETRRLRSVQATFDKKLMAGYQWHMWHLVEALGSTQRTDNLTATVSFVEVLMEVLTDRNQDKLSRVRASRAISRLPLDANTNLELINHEIALLVLEMCRAYQVDKQWPYWDRAFTEVFIAYDGFNANEIASKMGLRNQATKGPLGAALPAINNARDLMLPLIRTVVNSPAARPNLDAKAISDLEVWTKSAVPADRHIRPGGKAFPVAPAAPAAGASGITPPPAVPMSHVFRRSLARPLWT